MSDTVKLFTKPTISARLSADMVERIDKYFEILTGSTEPFESDRLFFEAIVNLSIERFERKGFAQTQQRVKELETENQQLKQQYEQLQLSASQQIVELEKSINGFITDNNQLKERLQQAQQQAQTDINNERSTLRLPLTQKDRELLLLHLTPNNTSLFMERATKKGIAPLFKTISDADTGEQQYFALMWNFAMLGMLNYQVSERRLTPEKIIKAYV